MPGKAIFLDRDGTLIEDVGYGCKPEQVELLQGVREAVVRTRELGYQLFLFTNQSGIGRGLFTLDDAIVCNQRMIELLGQGPDVFTEVCIAPEHPDEPPVYRKPQPRFILESMEKYDLDPAQCFMVGDRQSDWDAGLNADIQAVAVECGKPMGQQQLEYIAAKGIQLYPDFPAFVETLPKACFQNEASETEP